MTRYIVNEMVCDNRHDLHKMEEPRVFKTRKAAVKWWNKMVGKTKTGK